MNFIGYKKQSFATLKGVISYVCQTKKTGISREKLVQKHEVSVENLCELKLISGINCVAENAFSEFISTKESYEKTGGIQFYHYTQSFKDGENISPKTAHEIALEFAKENYGDYEVLVATHVDNDHLHSHFIVNSVNFATGKKLHQPPDTLRKLRLSSDNICKKFGFETLETYTFGRSKTLGRAENRARKRGTSWKFQLCLTIETAMKKAKNRAEFISKMEENGYKVSWKNDKNSIVYTHPNGNFCSSDRLYGKKYLRENMELEFDFRGQKDCDFGVETGWEFERNVFLQPTFSPPKNVLTKQILAHASRLEQSINDDDDLELIAEIGVLTMLSFAGVYLLLAKLSELNSDEITDETTEEIISELLLEPENDIDFEDDEEQFGFTMGGY